MRIPKRQNNSNNKNNINNRSSGPLSVWQRGPELDYNSNNSNKLTENINW